MDAEEGERKHNTGTDGERDIHILGRSLAAIRRSPNSALVVATLGLFMDMFTYSIVIPILPIYLDSAIGISSEFLLGLLYSAYACALLLSSPFVGIVCEKLGTKRTMIIGFCSLMLSTLLFSLGNHYAVLLVARILQGVSGAAVWIASLTMLADVFTHDLATKIGIAFSANSAGLIFGPFLGGVMFNALGYHLTFIITALFVGFDAVLRILLISDTWLREQKKMKLQEQQQSRVEPNKTSKTFSLKRFLTDGKVILLLVATAVGGYSFTFFEAIYPRWLYEKMDFTTEQAGLAFLVWGGTYAIATFLLGMVVDRVGALFVIVVGFLMTGAVFCAVPFALTTASIYGAMSGCGIATAILLIAPASEIVTHVNAHGGTSYAMGFSFATNAYCLGMFISPLISSALAGEIGFPWTVWMNGALIFLFGIFFFLAQKIFDCREGQPN